MPQSENVLFNKTYVVWKQMKEYMAIDIMVSEYRKYRGEGGVTNKTGCKKGKIKKKHECKVEISFYRRSSVNKRWR